MFGRACLLLSSEGLGVGSSWHHPHIYDGNRSKRLHRAWQFICAAARHAAVRSIGKDRVLSRRHSAFRHTAASVN